MPCWNLIDVVPLKKLGASIQLLSEWHGKITSLPSTVSAGSHSITASERVGDPCVQSPQGRRNGKARDACMCSTGTCGVRLCVVCLCRSALPLQLFHFRHIEVPLACQRAHKIDVVSFVDLQPGMGAQLPLLKERTEVHLRHVSHRSASTTDSTGPCSTPFS